LPALHGIFGGMSVRVPTPVVSLSDFVIITKKPVTVEQVNQAFKAAAKEPYYQGILDVTEEELVSSDFIGNSHSAIVDLNLTNVVGGNLVKVVAWYDNEWGYSNRLVEITADTGRVLQQGNVLKEGNMPADARPDNQDNQQAQGPPQPPEEGLLKAPSTEDFLPPATEPAVGEAPSEPHQVQDQHQPVEGQPGLQGPAQTLPEQGMPTDPVLPDTEPAGPDKPHEF